MISLLLLPFLIAAAVLGIRGWVTDRPDSTVGPPPDYRVWHPTWTDDYRHYREGGNAAGALVRLAARDGTCCHYCPANPPNAATVEHVVPRSKGGPDWDDNLVIACQRCNRKRSDRNEPHPGCDFCAAARAKYPAAA